MKARIWLCILAGAALGCLPALSSAQVYKSGTPAWFSGSLDIPLPFEANAVHQGPSATLVLPSGADQSLALLDPAVGTVGSAVPIAGRVIALAANATNEVAVITRTDNGALQLEIFRTTEGLGLVSWLSIGIAEIGPLTDPYLTYVTFTDSRRGEEQRLLVADRSADEKSGQYGLFVLTDRGFRPVPGSDWPGAVLPIGYGSNLLGLDHNDRAALIQDAASGEVGDAVPFDSLTTKVGDELTTFVPALPDGGVPNVIVADSQKQMLTVLTIGWSNRPLIGGLLQFVLSGRNGFGKGAGALRAAADRDMQFILLGALRSTEVKIIRRIKGGLDLGGSFELGSPLRDMTAIAAPKGATTTAFAFLSEDGRILTLKDQTSVESAQPAVTFNGPLLQNQVQLPQSDTFSGRSVEDIQRVQRTLAALGYQVGAIDGMAGSNTETALRAFQRDRGLETTGKVDEATAAALAAALTNGGVGEIVSSTVIEFNAFIEAALGRPFDGARLMVLGASQESPDNPCFGLNDFAPSALWPNAVKFANLLGRIEEEGFKVEVVTGYETAAASRCLAPKSADLHHEDFLAFDIRLAGTGENALSSERTGGLDTLAKLIRAFEDWGLTSADLSSDGLVLHVVPKIGEHQAVISSYKVSERSCADAKGDLADFVRLLAGSALAGREIMVSRLPDRDFYVVSVEANNARDFAEKAVGIIQGVSPKSADARTGRDARTMSGKALSFDPDCVAVQVIPDKASKS